MRHGPSADAICRLDLGDGSTFAEATSVFLDSTVDDVVTASDIANRFSNSKLAKETLNTSRYNPCDMSIHTCLALI